MFYRGRRRLYPRHLFPEFVAPWIQLRRARLRVIWFFTTPIHIKPLWTTSVTAGILGVMLTILLFRGAPRAEASTAAPSLELTPFAEKLVDDGPLEGWPAPETPASWDGGAADLWTELLQTAPDQTWNPRQQVTQRSTAIPGLDRLPSVLGRDDGWRGRRQWLTRGLSAPQPYRRIARAWPLHRPDAVQPDDVPGVGTVGGRSPALTVRREPLSSPDAHGRTTYALVIRNDGRDVLEDVVVTERLSDPDLVEDAQPPAAVLKNLLAWELGALPAFEERRLTVTLAPHEGANLAFEAEARTTTRVSSSTTVPELEDALMPMSGFELEPLPLDEPPARLMPVTPDPEPAPAPRTPRLLLRASPPRLATEGEELVMTFEIENAGDGDAQNVVVQVRLPEGLDHLDGRLIEHRIAHFPAATRRRAVLRVIPRRSGAARLQAVLLNGEVECDSWQGGFDVVAPEAPAQARKVSVR